MSKSQASFNKKEKEKQRLKKRQEKLQKKEERKQNAKTADFDSMIAYVDEHGNITDTPPDPTKKEKIKAKDIEIGVPKKEKEDTLELITGRVDYFNESKGFGFIREENSQARYFFHVSALLEEVKEQDKVTFEKERGPKGMNAVRIKKA